MTLKISQMRTLVSEYSSKASDIARQLAFAGIAVVWIFKVGGEGGAAGQAAISLPSALIPAVFFLVACLAADILHYVVAAYAWYLLAEDCTRVRADSVEKNDQEREFETGRRAAYGDFFFFAKLVLLGLGYAVLLKFLAGKWNLF